MHVVGEGSERRKIAAKAQSTGICDHVIFHGRMPRSQIVELLQKVECFCMISTREAFGLVYLEAMAASCIVVVAKRQGMDGIIQHGFNGFLCEGGDAQQLTEIFNFIELLSASSKNQISTNAINTAKEVTDSQVARRNLEVFE